MTCTAELSAGGARKSQRAGRADSRAGRLHGKSHGAHAGLLDDDVVDHGRDVLRLVGEADPGNVRGAGLPPVVREKRLSIARIARGGQSTGAPEALVIRAGPGAPVVLGIRRVAGANVELRPCPRSAPLSPHQVRRPQCEKILASNTSDSKLPLGSVAGTEHENLSGIGGGEKTLPPGPAAKLVTCAAAVLAMLRIDVVAFEFDHGSVVAGAEQDFAVRAKERMA